MIRMRLPATAICACLALLLISTGARALSRHPRNLTGTYVISRGPDHLDVEQLDRSHVRLYLWVTWKDHFGEVSGVFRLKNHTVSYRAPDGGKLTFRFSGNSVTILQIGRDTDLDFGANVSAAGVYHLRTRQTPKFHRLVGEG